MEIKRVWEMPNSRTFNIKAISSIIEKYAHGCIIDPFANNSRIATITNDIDTQFETTYHMDAIDFLNMFAPNSIDTVLYDPSFLIICSIRSSSVLVSLGSFKALM